MSELELRLVRIQNRWKFPEGFPLLPLWLSAVKNCSSESSNSSRPGILRATSGAVKPPLNLRKPNARWGGKAPFVAMVTEEGRIRQSQKGHSSQGAVLIRQAISRTQPSAVILLPKRGAVLSGKLSRWSILHSPWAISPSHRANQPSSAARCLLPIPWVSRNLFGAAKW